MMSPLVYHFFSLCLMYPQSDTTTELSTHAAEISNTEIKALADAFTAESIENLQIEYTRLFINNAEGVPCPPYESAYLDGQLLTTTTASVATFYAVWGIKHAQETADFLPIELQFLAYLLEFAAQTHAPEDAAKAHRQFESEHLLRWLPQFSADLEKHARLDCYRELGRQLAKFAASAG